MESEVGQRHFTFKEIEIDGDLQSFCNKLVAIGYSFEYFTDDHQTGVLTGSFAGKDFCEIHVISSKLINKVWKVYVDLPSQSTWSLLKSDYEFFKKICQKKYGKANDVYEFFLQPYIEGDGKELKALENKMLHFESYWWLKQGTIDVSIQSYMQVSISYEDAINVGLKSAAEEEAAEFDI